MRVGERLRQKATVGGREMKAWLLAIAAAAMLGSFGAVSGVVVGLAIGFDGGLVAGLGAALLVTTVAAPQLVRRTVWVAVALAWLVAAWLTSDQSADAAFYEQASQVVPVAFLALAVYASQTLRRSVDTRWWAAVSLTALLVAEYVCLEVVATGDSSKANALPLVAGGLAAAGVGLLLSILTAPKPTD